LQPAFSLWLRLRRWSGGAEFERFRLIWTKGVHQLLDIRGGLPAEICPATIVQSRLRQERTRRFHLVHEPRKQRQWDERARDRPCGGYADGRRNLARQGTDAVEGALQKDGIGGPGTARDKLDELPPLDRAVPWGLGRVAEHRR
jgi:hypothetical protein